MGLYYWRILIYMFLIGNLAACMPAISQPVPSTTPVRSGLLAPLTFKEGDLIGEWKNTFTQYQTEILILTPDHRFKQIFDTNQPLHHYEGTGSWHVEQRVSGCVYLHLEGMRYFYGAEAFEKFGNRFTPHGDPYAFWERCEAQSIPMPDKLILTVMAFPNAPRGVGLLLPATTNEPSDSQKMVLVADTNGVPIVRPTKSAP